MADEPGIPGPDQLARLGVYDPSSVDAPERLALLRYLFSLGASVDQIEAAAASLGDLALDLALRPERPSRVGAVVADAGVAWDDAYRLLTAVGFSGDPDERITEAEAATALLLVVVSRDLLGEAATSQLARVAGNAMARVAQTIVTTFRLNVELPRRNTGISHVDVVKEYAEMAQSLLPAFVSALDALLRRQLVAVTERMWSTDEEQSAVTMSCTVGFVDLVGYTAAAASMSISELTSVLIQFDERTADAVLGGRGQIVKTIGDEAMFVTDDAVDACRIGLDLVRAFRSGSLPPVRVGLATGEVVSVFGDLYGQEVNRAARLVAAAAPSTVVVSEPVRAACGDAFTFSSVGALALKGFAEPVPAYRLDG
jgi:class 3 adenylate cyclase